MAIAGLDSVLNILYAKTTRGLQFTQVEPLQGECVSVAQNCVL